MHDHNSFITLTYAPEQLPQDGSLDVRHFQQFMKELRGELAPKRIRFFHCGEYGENLKRPHYHALIFGHDFPDKYHWGRSKTGEDVFRSEQLERLWRRGYSNIGSVTWQSAGYVARYITKKVTGENADDHYQGLKPEYVTMSRRPGIGFSWYQRFKGDLYPKDFLTINGKRYPVPGYYDRLLERDDPDRFCEIRDRRIRNSRCREKDNSERRLRDREVAVNLKQKHFDKRNIPNAM